MSRRILLVASAAYAAAQLSSNNEPCAIAAAGLARSTVIPAEVAFECLNSVPVDVQGNSQLIDELKIVWQWQSELEWLKNPGQDWEYGPLDIEAELDDIKGKLSSFQSEYAVQLAIQNITVRTGNYHFNYAPDILQVFGFQRGLGIASISSDGQSLPKIYAYEDALALAAGASDVSDITEINGQSVYDYLVDNAYSQYIDSDGRLNKQFTHGDTNNPGAFDQQEIYQGAETAFTWSNGSSATITNIAGTNQDFSLIADGESFFRAFCTGMISGASSSADTTKTRSSISPGLLGPVPRIPHGNPHRTKRQTIPGQYASNPVTQSSSGVVEGFFLDGNGFSDVAVLKIISFSNPDSSDDEAFTKDFQATIASFLRQSVSEGKSKLIIDLRENGGGSVDLLLDAFMQIFPGKEPFSGQRYRATDTFNKIGDIVNELYTDPAKSRSLMNTFGVGIEEVSRLRFWLWWHFRTAEGENFSGWDQFNGPLNLNNDKLTTTMRYNYSNSDQVSIRSEGFSFTTNPPASPFDPSNIVMFTDALCGSSCASFHEELKNIAGIRSVTVGGRPRTGPIQAVAGTKGGEVAPLVFFTRMAGLALNISSEIDLKTVKANDASLIAMANVPAIYTRAGDAMSRAQSQDQVRKGDKSATPLQFIYEAADCRIFYTPESFADPDQAWKQAWSAFQDDSKCVEGSTKHKSSISGGFKPYGAGELKAEDQPDASGSGDKDNAASGLRMGAWGVAVGVMGLMAML